MQLTYRAAVDAQDDLGRTLLHEVVKSNYKIGVVSLLEAGACVDIKDKDGNTSLHLAKNTEIIKLILSKGANVGAKNINKKTPLHLFAVEDNEPCIKLLLDEGAKVNVRDKEGNAALHDAASTDCNKAINILLHKGAKCEAKNKYGSTPVNIAAIKDSYVSLKLLIEAGANVNVKEKCGNTPLHNAAGASYNTIKLLLEKGSDVEAKNRYGATPLHLFAAKGNQTGIRLLLNAGAKVNVTDNYNKTALHNVVYNFKYVTPKELLDRQAQLEPDSKNISKKSHFKLKDYHACLELLINLGASVNVESKHCGTPFLFSAYSSNSSLVKTLIDKGVNLDKYHRHLRPLHIAAKQNNAPCIKVLLKAGAQVDIESDPLTPLHLAAMNGYSIIKTTKKNKSKEPLIDANDDNISSVSVDISKIEHNPICLNLLLDAGANVNARDFMGNTPLHAAAAYGCYENIKILINKGCNVDAENGTGLTALHLVAEDYQSCLELLLDSGANANVRSSWGGLTPLHLASSNGCVEAVKILLENGADWNCTNYFGGMPIHYASSTNYGSPTCAALLLLLEAGCEVNVRNFFGDTPLHFAARTDGYDIIKTLIGKGAELEARNKFFLTPLIVASKTCNESNKLCIELLLEAGADINVIDVEGNTPLHMLAGSNCFDVIKTLINKGVDVEPKNILGLTPLIIASKTCNESNQLCMELLLEVGADINVLDNDGNTPLHIVAGTNCFEVIKTLINKGAELDVKNVFGLTPLIIACKKYNNLNKSCVEVLLEAGADVNVSGSRHNNMPLHYAAYIGSYDLIKTLTYKNADLEARNKTGSTPLILAATMCNNSSIALLLEIGAEINVKDELGNTPLFHAIKKGSYESVKTLLDSGADIEAINKKEKTPLIHAASSILLPFKRKSKYNVRQWDGNEKSIKDYNKIIQLLVDRGAELEAKDGMRSTPLHFAASFGDKERVNILLVAGADINARDKQGNTPLHYSARCGNIKTASLLLAKGANINAKNDRNETPLHTHCLLHERKFVLSYLKLLIRGGADVNIQNVHNETLLHICVTHGLYKAINILLSNGALVNVEDIYNNTPLDISIDRILIDITTFSTYINIVTNLLFWGALWTEKNVYHSLISNEILKKYIIMLKSANIDVQIPEDDFSGLEDFQTRCSDEIRRMKLEGVTVHHFFSQYNSSDPVLAGNKSVRKLLYSSRRKNEYPIYSRLLQVKFQKPNKRYNLLNEAQKCLQIHMPSEVKRTILSYVSDKDLTNVIKAAR